jgi:branched-chain amino acid transport system substrate-binding protein
MEVTHIDPPDDNAPGAGPDCAAERSTTSSLGGPMRQTMLRAATVLFAVSLVAAACGDDDDDDESSATGGETTAAPADDTAATGATDDTAATDDSATDDTAATDDTTGGGGSGQTPDAPDAAELDAAVAGDPLVGPEGTGLTRGVTDDTVTFGCVIQASAYAGAEDAFRARFERANAEGGVHGRRIEMLPCDDDAVDTSQNLQIVRRQVLQDEVFGMLTLTAQAGVPTTDFLTENEVPYFGWALTSGFCGHRWGFGLNGCLIGDFLPDLVPHGVVQGNISQAIIAASGLDPAEVRFAAQSADDAASAAGAALYERAFEAAGATVVYNEHNLPLQTSDFTPYVQALLDTDPNLVFVATAFENVGGLSAALKAAGYDGISMNFVGYIPGLLESSPQLADALDGAYVNTQLVPQEAQTPYIIQLEDDLEAVEAENGRFITFGAGLAYMEADLVVQLLEAAGPELDTATFDAAANGGGFRYEPLPGGPGGMNYPEDHFLPTDCAAIVRIEGTTYEIIEDFACYDSYPVE